MIEQLLFAGLVPMILMGLAFSYLKYRFPNGVLTSFLLTYFYGIVASIFVILLQMGVEKLGLAELKSLKRTAFHAFVVVGLVNYLAVFLVLIGFYFKNGIIRKPADGLVYTAGIAMGLSFLTGIELVIHPSHEPFYKQLMMTYPFAMLITSAPLGFFAGMAAMRKNTAIDLLAGLSGSSFFLGLYVFCLYTHETLLWYGSGIVTFGLALLLVYKAIDNDWFSVRN